MPISIGTGLAIGMGGGVSDVIKPTVVITSTETSPSLAATIPLTITFSENVTGFLVGDITVVGCTLGALTAVSAKVYTVSATPIAASITVDIADDVCIDGAGNGNSAATQFTFVPLIYSFNEGFTTDASAPLTSPRTCEPGPGSLTIIDASNIFSIASSKLLVSGTPAQNAQMVSAAIPFVAGRVLSWTLSETAGYFRVGFHNITTLPLAMKFSINVDAGSNAVGITDYNASVAGFQLLTPTPKVGTYYIIMRENKGAFYVKDNELLWIGRLRPVYANLYAGLLCYGTLAQNLTVDDLRIFNVSASSDINTEYGLATSITATPANGEAITATADGTFSISWTPKANEVLTFLFRRTDDDNTLKLVADQAAGTIKLYTRTGGTDTEINSGKTQVWAVDNPYGISISTRATVVQTRVNWAENNQLHHNTTSSVNQTATGVKISSSDGTPTINNLEAWPRVLTGFPFI